MDIHQNCQQIVGENGKVLNIFRVDSNLDKISEFLDRLDHNGRIAALRSVTRRMLEHSHIRKKYTIVYSEYYRREILSSKLNFACTSCGMASSRWESVVRHILNPRIHDGRARVIAYAEYLAGIQAGLYRPADSIYRQRYKDVDGRLIGRRGGEDDSYFDKLNRKIEDKQIERHAEAIVSTPTFSSKRSFKANFAMIPNVSTYSFKSEDIFGISGYVCNSCLTIKPAVYFYSDKFDLEKRAPSINFIDPCLNCKSQMSNEEKNHYLAYNLNYGIAPILFDWIRVFWGGQQRMKLIAIRVSDPEVESSREYSITPSPKIKNSSTGQHDTWLRIEARGKFPSRVRKIIQLFKDDEPVIEVRNIFPNSTHQTAPIYNIDHFPIIHAITKSEYIITSERDINSFLYYTKFKTFGLFRLNLGLTWLGNVGSTPVDEDGIYLLMLVPDELTLDLSYSCEMNHDLDPNESKVNQQIKSCACANGFYENLED